MSLFLSISSFFLSFLSLASLFATVCSSRIASRDPVHPRHSIRFYYFPHFAVHNFCSLYSSLRLVFSISLSVFSLLFLSLFLSVSSSFSLYLTLSPYSSIPIFLSLCLFPSLCFFLSRILPRFLSSPSSLFSLSLVAFCVARLCQQSVRAWSKIQLCTLTTRQRCTRPSSFKSAHGAEIRPGASTW